MHGCGRGGVCGDVFDHLVVVDAELQVADVADGDMQRAEDQRRTLQIDRVAHEGVDDFHQSDLERFLVLDESDGMQAGLRWSADATDHALVEVAELLSAHGGGAATDSGDLDVGATANVRMNWHGYTSVEILISLS
jgi:hypothetical protein